MIRVFIADDHAVVREGVKHILSDSSDIKFVGEASNGQEVLEKIGRQEFDILILDIAMPGRDGLEIIKEVKMQKPKVSILMLSMFPEEQYALRALRSGASGYMTKDSIPNELVKAIRQIFKGGKYVSSSFSEKLLTNIISDTGKPLHEKLSDREFQIMKLIASGKSVSDIANELFLSSKTVYTYRSRILEKMGMKNNIEMTHYATKHGLID